MTTRRLVLVRHAKAGEGPTDARRPLAPRGERDAAAIGTWLTQHRAVPDQVVVSTALRAEQTWQRAAAVLATAPPVDRDARIYENTVDGLLAVIRDTPPDVETLALVGHNPSMAALAHELDDGAGDAAARAELDAGFPTSGIAVFTVTVPWADVDLATAALTHVSAPRG